MPIENRDRLLAELAGYVAHDAHERAMQAEILRFISENDACFERTLRTGHVTASAWVVDSSCSLVLLTNHRKLGKWLQLGGHADGDSDVRAVALREAQEESGLSSLHLARAQIYDMDVHEIPAQRDEPAHFHYDLRFAFFADSCEAPIVSDESHDVRWVTLGEVPSLTSEESMRRMVAKTQNLLVDALRSSVSAARARRPS